MLLCYEHHSLAHLRMRGIRRGSGGADRVFPRARVGWETSGQFRKRHIHGVRDLSGKSRFKRGQQKWKSVLRAQSSFRKSA